MLAVAVGGSFSYHVLYNRWEFSEVFIEQGLTFYNDIISTSNMELDLALDLTIYRYFAIYLDSRKEKASETCIFLDLLYFHVVSFVEACCLGAVA